MGIQLGVWCSMSVAHDIFRYEDTLEVQGERPMRLNTAKILVAVLGAVFGAAGGYAIAFFLSGGDAAAFTAIATSVFGGVFLSASFSGVYSAYTATTEQNR